MIIIGLTGSVGTGKTEVSNYFIRNKISVFDSDKKVRLIHENRIVQQEISRLFPDSLVARKVDRKKLATVVFGDKKKLTLLENIIYVRLKQIQSKWIRTQISARKKIVVFDTPLLFEKDILEKYDIKILLTCSDAVQKNRVLKRANWSLNRFNLTKELQMKTKEKKLLADEIVFTDRGKRKTFQDIQNILNKTENHIHRNANDILRNFN
tara:strand:- start:1637 stop:2263 length:627 start_codon:yes stop_codon:yes gene_type:complete